MNKIKNLRRNKKGFTLVEVIVVLVILAILIAIAVPSVMKYIDDANEAKYLAEARAAYIATEAEVTKDYGDNKSIDYSIYTVGNKAGTVTDFLAAIKEGCGFEVTSVVTNPTISANLNPNNITAYTVTFVSPSSNTTVTVEIKKNGTATIVEPSETPTPAE